MKKLKPGDVLVLTMKIKRNWRIQELTILAVHKGKSFSFLTVSNGIYRQTLDLWALKKDIKDGKARISIKRAI
jgi:hypothetical protein